MADLLLLPARCLAAIASRSPLPLVQALGSLLGSLWFFCLPIRRREVLANIRRALPGLSGWERLKIALGAYRHVAVTVLELFWATGVSRGALEAVISVEGFERYERIRDQGRGVIAVTAHVGNWDLLACSQALAGVPLNVVTKELSARGLSGLWMEARARLGVRLLGAQGSALAILRALRRGEVVGLVIDQRLPAELGGRPVAFFGSPAMTTVAPHVLAHRTGAALLPVRSFRRADGTHRVEIEEEVPLAKGAEETMSALNRKIEGWIREKPEQYLWHHRRWREAEPRGDCLGPQ